MELKGLKPKIDLTYQYTTYYGPNVQIILFISIVIILYHFICI